MQDLLPHPRSRDIKAAVTLCPMGVRPGQISVTLAQIFVFCRPAVVFLLYATQDSPLSIMYKYQDAGVFCLTAVSCEIYVRRFEATTLISMVGLP